MESGPTCMPGGRLLPRVKPGLTSARPPAVTLESTSARSLPPVDNRLPPRSGSTVQCPPADSLGSLSARSLARARRLVGRLLLYDLGAEEDREKQQNKNQTHYLLSENL